MTQGAEESVEERHFAVRLGQRLSEQDGSKLKKGSQGSPTYAQGWSRSISRPTQPTPPLDALKMVLSEIATGGRGRKVVAIVHVRRAYFYAPSPSRWRVFVEVPPDDYQVGDEHRCVLLQYSLYGTRDAAQSWEEELAATLSNLKMTRGIGCPCVSGGSIKNEDVVATVHGDDIKIGGERSAVGCVV